MKAGDVINGYTILEDFRVVGAGLSKWTFAAKDGRQYFIKEFLSPTYPDEHAPGSAQTKMRKRRRCAEFERHQRRIQEAGTTARELTQKADIFALGLIYSEYLTGRPPPFDATSYQYAGVAVRAGEVLRLPSATLSAPMVELVDRMLLADPTARPTVGEVHAILMGIRTPATTIPAGPSAAATPSAPSRLKGRGCARPLDRHRRPRLSLPDQAAGREAPGAKKGSRRPMSTQWRCAVCETVNDDGETCVACGAPRSEAATAVTPTAEAPTQPAAPEEVPVRELPVRSQPEREHEPPQYGTDDLRDFFDLPDVYRADEGYEDAEMIDTRPRIRVYGCCLPLALGILLTVAATLTGGAALLIRVF